MARGTVSDMQVAMVHELVECCWCVEMHENGYQPRSDRSRCEVLFNFISTREHEPCSCETRVTCFSRSHAEAVNRRSCSTHCYSGRARCHQYERKHRVFSRWKWESRHESSSRIADRSRAKTRNLCETTHFHGSSKPRNKRRVSRGDPLLVCRCDEASSNGGTRGLSDENVSILQTEKRQKKYR